jgi:hypothetical protein
LNTAVQLAAIGSDGALLQDVTGDPDCADRNLRMDAPKQCVASFSSSFGSWQRMGDAVNTPTAQQAPALALDTAELPVMASIERGAAAVDFVVLRRFTGVWQALGPPQGGGVNHATSPTLVVDPANNPVLAWTEGDGTRSNVYLARYSLARSRYEPVGASNLPLNFTPNSRATWPALAVHPSGLLMLAWVENGVPVAKFFDGLGWRALPAGAGPAGRTTAAPKLVLDGAGFAVLAWVDADAPGAVHVARAGSNGWAELGALALGPSPAAETFVNGLGLAVDGADRPLVAWMQGGLQAYASYVRRWDGSQWQPIEAAPSNTTAADGFAFAVNGSGQPVVVVTQPRVGGHTVRRARFNGLDWVEPALLSTDTRLVGMQLAVPPSDFDGAVLSWLRTQPGPVLEAWRYFP